jgi:hypothetical protein
MSYGRNPYYIWSDGEKLWLNDTIVDEKIINAFLYKVLLLNRREELIQRLQEGKQVWMVQKNIKGLNDLFNKKEIMTEEEFKEKMKNLVIIEEPQDQRYIDWMNSQEDNILKQLMGKGEKKEI